MTTILVRRLEADVGPGDETGGTTNLTTVAQNCSFLLAADGATISVTDVMTAKRAAAYSGAALLLLAWLASAAGLVRQTSEETEPERSPEPPAAATLADEVHAQ